VEDPVRVLRHSWELSSGFLIVQSAVSMANDDPAYFETPAHGWDWGSRFNRRSFQRPATSGSRIEAASTT